MGAVQALATLILLACATKDPGEGLYAAASAAVDDPKKLDAVLATAPDDVTHDVVVQRLAVDHPAKAALLCGRMRTDDGRQKCAKVLGRPHLGGTPK